MPKWERDLSWSPQGQRLKGVTRSPLDGENMFWLATNSKLVHYRLNFWRKEKRQLPSFISYWSRTVLWVVLGYQKPPKFGRACPHGSNSSQRKKLEGNPSRETHKHFNRTPSTKVTLLKTILWDPVIKMSPPSWGAPHVVRYPIRQTDCSTLQPTDSW